LANLGRDIDATHITVATVPSTGFVTADGADVQLIDQRKLAGVVATVFTQPPALAESPAAVAILNGTTTPGLATAWADVLERDGVTVSRFDSATTGSQVQTVIYAAPGTRRTAEQVARVLGLALTRVEDDTAPGQPAGEVLVLLGSDTMLPANR
jgi:hypothetical protein